MKINSMLGSENASFITRFLLLMCRCESSNQEQLVINVKEELKDLLTSKITKELKLLAEEFKISIEVKVDE